MKVTVPADFRSAIDLAAEKLRAQNLDETAIEGVDNPLLVRTGSDVSKQMLADNRVLFPVTAGGTHCLVCIARAR